MVSPKKLFVLLVCRCGLSPAQSVPHPPLDQLIDEALGRNLRLIAKRYNIPIAEARIIQARLRPNPTFLLQWHYMDIFSIGCSATNNSAGPPELDAGLIPAIVRGGKRQRGSKPQGGRKPQPKPTSSNASRTLIFDMSIAWVDLLLSREQLALARQSQEALEQIVRVNRA